jgi:hypothetical protein
MIMDQGTNNTVRSEQYDDEFGQRQPINTYQYGLSFLHSNQVPSKPLLICKEF